MEVRRCLSEPGGRPLGVATFPKAENRGFCRSFLPKFPLFSHTPSAALPGSVLGGLEQTRTLTMPRGVFAAIQGTLCLLKACVAEIPRAALQKPPRNPSGGRLSTSSVRPRSRSQAVSGLLSLTVLEVLVMPPKVAGPWSLRQGHPPQHPSLTPSFSYRWW